MNDFDALSPVFVWVVLALASHRYQRLVTTDHWPISQWFRRYIDRRFGERSSWAELVNCGWCFGSWTTIAVFCEHFYLGVVPFVVHVIAAAATVVGLISTYDGE